MNSCAKIDLNAFSHNLRFIKNLLAPKTKLMAVLKADAYGHGSVMLARQAEKDAIDMLGVANLSEAIELKNAGIKLPILLLSGVRENQIKLFMNYDFSTVVYSKENADALLLEAKLNNKPIKAHIKVDTGMGRLGFAPDNLHTFLNQYSNTDNFILEGLMTHLASAYDKKGRDFTQSQLKIFSKLVENMKTAKISFPFVHCANSAGIIDFPESHFTMVRPGIVMYGISPFNEKRDDLDIKPALSWETKVMQISSIPKGKPISYGGTFITKRDSLIAAIPVGYADGYNRLLSNKAKVIINSSLAPQVGIVCMDIAMVDVTDIPKISVGDKAILIGAQGKEEIKATDLSDITGTIPYETLCSIGDRVTRVYKDN